MRVNLIWTEVNQHSAQVEAPDGADLTDEDVLADLLEQAIELTGTYDGTESRTVDGAEPA
jgi:hypothetical protein